MPQTNPKKVIAVLCSDIHLSHTPPVSRAAEPDWYEAMLRPIKQINYLSNTNNCPVVCAGDVFDRWNSPPELVNFAIKNLPRMYAIPGQHDLPYHDFNEIKKSAFWTLVECEVVELLYPNSCMMASQDLCLWGFPWGSPVQPLEEDAKNNHTAINGTVHLAVVHEYVWRQGSTYPGAPEENNVSNLRRRLTGYDACVVGDNHKGFLSKGAGDGIHILNNGSLMRRKSDEIPYRPQVGLLHADASITTHELTYEDDKFIHEAYVTNVEEKANEHLEEFLQGLKKLGAEGLSFTDALVRYMEDNKLGPPVCEALRKAAGL